MKRITQTVLVIILAVVACVNATDFTTYPSRMRIGFDGYDRGEMLSDFPALVVLSTNLPGFRYEQMGTTNGVDLRFSDSTLTNELSFEIEKWNTNGESFVWVRVPSVSTTNDHVWMHWGHTSATSAPPYSTNGLTWNSDFKGVWHLGGDFGGGHDSTTNAFHGVVQGGTTQNVSAVMADGCLFDGSSGRINLDAHVAGFAALSEGTISAWFKSSVPNERQAFFAISDGSESSEQVAIDLNHDEDIEFRAEDGIRVVGDKNGYYADGKWHYVAVSVDATGNRMFLGSKQVTMTYAYGSATSTLFCSGISGLDRMSIGRNVDINGGEWHMAGMLDEVRVSSPPRSTNWLWATCRNAVSNTTFLGYMPGCSVGGTVLNQQQADGVTRVLACSTTNFADQISTFDLLDRSDYAIFFGENTNVWIHAYRDMNTNGTREAWEPQASHDGNPLMLTGDCVTANMTLDEPDLDDDDLPDWWEMEYGLNISSNDAAVDSDLDGLNNLQEYLSGARPNAQDSDGDTLWDGAEYYEYGSSPATNDTDGDGLPDGWEVQYGLNPTAADADADADFDWISNLDEYLQALNPSASDSDADGTNDYRAIYGFDSKRYLYDAMDQLLGMESTKGLSISYLYDENGNVISRAYLRRDKDGDGLPDIWEHQNGLSWTNATGNDGASGDGDNDGWSNLQEWRADSDPTLAASTPLSGIATLSVGFNVTNFTLGVGDFNRIGGEEVVVAAIGDPGTSSNALLLLSQDNGTWTSDLLDMGAVEITSVAVGRTVENESGAIYVGLAGTTGSIIEIRQFEGLWTTNTIAWAAGPRATVLGVRDELDVVAGLDATNVSGMALWSLMPTTSGWKTTLLSSNAPSAGVGALFNLDDYPADQMSLRLVETGGPEIGASAFENDVLAAYTFRKSAVDVSGNGRHGTDDGSGNTDDRYGRSNSAFDFDGTTFVSIPNFLKSHFTLEAWVRSRTGEILDGSIIDGYAAEEVGALQYGYINSDSPDYVGYDGQGWYLRGKVHPLDTSEKHLLYRCGITNGDWHHAALAFDGTEARLYLNGEDVRSHVFPVTNSLVERACNLRIARDSSGPRFEGRIDDARIWARGLTLAEIKQAMNQRWPEYPASVQPSPPATNRMDWLVPALCGGNWRVPASAACAFIDDLDGSGTISSGDNFVVADYLGVKTNWTEGSVTRIRMELSSGRSAYAMAAAEIHDGSAEFLFTGEPDGGVYVWSEGATNLERSLFSDFHVGSEWHQLAPHKGLHPGEGLVGLRVDPQAPNQCEVTYWAASGQAPAAHVLQQTAPITRIMPSPSAGGNLARVDVRIWDAEGNDSLPVLQYQDPISSNWLDATLTEIDGDPYSMTFAVEAMPTGSLHALTWNAGLDLGPSFDGSVALRSRSVDITLWGEWSEIVSYQVTLSDDSDGDGMPDGWESVYGLNPLSTNGNDGAAGDIDSDGMDNLAEYYADTCPTNDESFLWITNIVFDAGGVQIDWQGGIDATQWLEESMNLTNDDWIAIFTNDPPTSNDESVIYFSTNDHGFFRIKAGR